MLFYELSVKETLERFKTDAEKGLNSSEVLKRRKRFGRNELEVKGTPLWKRILEPFIDIFMAILIVALLLSAIQGAWTEVIMITVIIVINAIIDYVQQFSTERILRGLKQKTVQKADVLRNGDKLSIDAWELVPGDVVFLDEGDRIPADGRIINESGLLTNESMLTGESDPVAKDANKLSGAKKVYERRNMVFSGSFVVTGKARMLVVATGNNTEYGRIASLASGAESISPIQEKISKLIFKIAITVVVLAVFVLVIQLVRGIDFLSATEFTLAMIVSAVPESLPIAISVVLALGARRMAKKNALIKEMRAIESIGIVTTIASDKTGTLTENKLSVTGKWQLAESRDFDKLVAMAALPSSISNDALDVAIARQVPKNFEVEPAKSYAFDQTLKISGNLFAKNHLVIKGAPEEIIEKCRLSEGTSQKIDTEINRITARGHKAIAIADIKLEREINELNRLPKSVKFNFVGLISVADTIRKEAPEAIADARKAGVKVKMITGDHWQTAYEIGKDLGLVSDEAQVYDCSKMGNVSDEEFEKILDDTMVFARVTPEDKFRLLALMKKHEITAMTGDGVNDVPALANAHIGIAMGSGPSIVQDAGDIVLLDDNFKSVVTAMKEGRVVLTNIRRMLMYLLATNAGEVLTIIIALILGGENLLLPIQILWVNLVTDSLMVVPIGLEPSEEYFLRQKPDKKDAPILNGTLLGRMVLIALTMAAITITTYFVADEHLTHEQANTLTFTALVVMQWANAFNSRALHEPILKRLRTHNWKFWVALVPAILLQIAALFTNVGHEFLHTVAVPGLALGVVAVASFAIPIVVVEIHKVFVKKFSRS